MKKLAIGLLTTCALIFTTGATLAQSFEVGPGGVRVYPDRPRVYEDRRGYDDRQYARPRGGFCARLRDACEYGPRGEGNCRRYRAECG